MRLIFVGDINLGEYYTNFGHGPGSVISRGEDPFQNVAEIFKDADCVIGNLEAPLTNHNIDANEPESVVLRGTPEAAALLSKHNFKAVQVANNHIVQHGDAGFDETIKALQKEAILPIGINNDEITVLEVRGNSIGLMAASDVPDNTDVNQTQYQRLTSDFIKRCKDNVKQVDHLFVMLHWGLEASTEPMEYQTQLIQELKDAGVRGVIGCHPHLFYEVWKDDHFIAAPSLGNFVFDLPWDERLLKSGILKIELSEDSLSAQIWPVYLDNDGTHPTPSSPVEVHDRVKLYDLGESMKGEQFRKLAYFFRNYLKGNSRLKRKFILRKFFPILRKKRSVHCA